MEEKREGYAIWDEVDNGFEGEYIWDGITEENKINALGLADDYNHMYCKMLPDEEGEPTIYPDDIPERFKVVKVTIEVVN